VADYVRRKRSSVLLILLYRIGVSESPLWLTKRERRAEPLAVIRGKFGPRRFFPIGLRPRTAETICGLVYNVLFLTGARFGLLAVDSISRRTFLVCSDIWLSSGSRYSFMQFSVRWVPCLPSGSSHRFLQWLSIWSAFIP
jgi:hypothetical protein